MDGMPVIAVTYSSRELHKFTLWRQMFRGVMCAGGIPLAIECGEGERDMNLTLPHVDALILGGGGDLDPALYGGDPTDPLLQGVNPVRDSNEAHALEVARQMKLPILAVCRGAQLVNVAMGGDLYIDLTRDSPGASIHRHSEDALASRLHDVDVAPHSKLSEALGSVGTAAVNSQHHQGIRTLAPDLIASAWAADGLIEGFESATEKIIGVQWHPEVIWPSEPTSFSLLEHFVNAGRGIAANRLTPAP